MVSYQEKKINASSNINFQLMIKMISTTNNQKLDGIPGSEKIRNEHFMVLCMPVYYVSM